MKVAREPNVYKPHGFFLGFLATFICFCVTVLFYRYLYFVVNQIKLQSYIFFEGLIIGIQTIKGRESLNMSHGFNFLYLV